MKTYLCTARQFESYQKNVIVDFCDNLFEFLDIETINKILTAMNKMKKKEN